MGVIPSTRKGDVPDKKPRPAMDRDIIRAVERDLCRLSWKACRRKASDAATGTFLVVVAPATRNWDGGVSGAAEGGLGHIVQFLFCKIVDAWRED